MTELAAYLFAVFKSAVAVFEQALVDSLDYVRVSLVDVFEVLESIERLG